MGSSTTMATEGTTPGTSTAATETSTTEGTTSASTTDEPTSSTIDATESTGGSTSDGGGTTGDEAVVSCSELIAFQRAGDVWSVAVADGTETNLSDHPSGDGDHDWAPNGDELVFISSRAGGPEVYRVTTAGVVSVVTTDEPGPRDPQWTADGSRIVFMVDASNAINGDIVSLGPEGTNRELVDLGFAFYLYDSIEVNDAATQVLNVEADLAGGLGSRIMSLALPGGNVTPFTSFSDDDRDPRFSPNNQQIAFERRSTGDIVLISSAGASEVNLTDDVATAASSPRWSPDGSKLTYVADIGGNTEVFVMDSDGGNKVNLTDSVGQDISPVFSPDGLQIAFLSDRDGELDLWVMDADGQNPVRLTDTAEEEEEPAWQPCQP